MRKAILHLKKCDPVMARIIEQVGPFRMTKDEPSFAHVAEAIVYQQLHGKAAATIFKRLTDLTGLPLTPEGLLKLTEEQMRSAGLSKQKLSYLRDLAAKAQSREVDFSAFGELSDEEVIEQLTKVKGIGVWTAHMFLMFALQRPDVLPVGDLGIQMAIRKHYLSKAKNGNAKRRKFKPLKPKQMEKIARCWAPYRSVASWYLWRSLDVKPPGQ